MRDLTGIERRIDGEGREQFRPYVTDPANRNRKIRGSWTYSYDEALGWRRRARKNGPPEREPVRSLPTIDEASEAFMDGVRAGTILSRKRRPYEAKTARGYEQAFRDWVNPELGDDVVNELRRSRVQRWVDGLAAIRSGATTRNAFHALAALYTYLLPRHDEIDHDPTHGIVLPAPADIRERYADVDEIAAFIAALPRDLAMPYALAFYAGLRNAEIKALPADMVDLASGWLRVQYALDPKTGFKGPKSGAGERDVPIFDPLRPYLEHQLARLSGPPTASTQAEPGTLLLPSLNKHGTPSHARWGTRTFGSKFLAACEAHWAAEGLGSIGLHEARHSFATAMIRAGYDVKLVQEWIGHADPSTTLKLYVKHRGRVDASSLVAQGNRYLAPTAP